MTSGVGSTAVTSSNNSSNSTNSSNSLFPSIIELNVGGVFYTTALSTLTRDGDSLLAQMFTGRSREPVLRDSKGKYFIDRDGVLFRYTLDYLRDGTLMLPHNFHERDRLKREADYFQLGTFSRWLASSSSDALTNQNNPESGKSIQSIGLVYLSHFFFLYKFQIEEIVIEQIGLTMIACIKPDCLVDLCIPFLSLKWKVKKEDKKKKAKISFNLT